MHIRSYLRASTKSQDASRAEDQIATFLSGYGLQVGTPYIENVSGASLARPELLKLISHAQAGDVLLVESIDRLSRLNDSDWLTLKQAISAKGLKVVSLDLPTSWAALAPAPASVEDFQESMLTAINGMLLDMLAAISRKDYLQRRVRSAQGIQKAKDAGKYKGRQEDAERNTLIQKHLKAGISSWNEIMELVGCSRGTVAKQAAILKAAA
jgi:DNA invertase Pin-like site-specific DNA recombinase